MEIKSKFRLEYWVMQFVMWSLWLSVIVFFFYHSLKNGKIDFRNIALYAAIVLLIGTISYLKTNFYYDIKQITISEKGILLKYYFDNKKEFFEYKKILSLQTSRHSNHESAGERDGYESLEILLDNDECISFSAMEYENYHQLKRNIYSNLKDANNNSENY